MTRKSVSSPKSNRTVAARVEPDTDGSQPAGLGVPQDVSSSTYVVCHGPPGIPRRTPVDVDNGALTLKTEVPGHLDVGEHDFQLTHDGKTYAKRAYCGPTSRHNPLYILIDQKVP